MPLAPVQPDAAGRDATDAIDAANPTDVLVEASGPCTADIDCSDRVFCNGIERCMPGAAGADARGCVAANPPNPCLPGQRCDDPMQRCVSTCSHVPDADGDGHRAIDCGGDDCDDSDSNRFPGNPEVCDASNHDEDCDARTPGFRDGDMDHFSDAQCCNTDTGGAMHCGDDCNDSRSNVHPALAEVCDGLDNNCDGAVDEGVELTFYPDRDHDGFGDGSAPVSMQTQGCTAPVAYAERGTDCNDANDAVHPGAAEQCDAAMVDENCDGVANPSTLCTCSGDVTRSCATAMGACAAGTQRCVNGSWGACSIAATTEVCNGDDDDCDGTVDETLSVSCFADGDNDGYSAAGATAALTCPVPGRDAFAGCPPNQTNRAPMDIAIDCNDADSTISPGQPEICDPGMRDENCDGVRNPSSQCNCTDGATRACTSPGTCGAGTQVCSAGQFGGCSIQPVAESCNGTDDDCDGMVDEGLTVTCYADNDNDGFAASGAAALRSCPVMGRGYVGGCPTGQTNVAPVAASGSTPATIDCSDTDAMRNPAAPELCDSAMVDEDCDGAANPASLCDCAGTASRMCTLSGACAAGIQTCSSGHWGGCSISPVAESCNGIDDDCDGSIDESLTVTCYGDADNDGYAPSGAAASQQCPVAGRTAVGGCPTGQTNRAPTGTDVDCADAASSTNPAVIETCNAVDDDCDGLVDEGVMTTFYIDADGDGFGSAAAGAMMRQACATPSGYSPNRLDCDDTAPARNPIAPDVCDGIDNNCNGLVDESVLLTFYIDADGDGYGSSAIGAMTRQSCSALIGYSSNRLDCDDSNAGRNAGAPEVCDGIDNNCNGIVDDPAILPITTCLRDVDGDGYGNPAMTLTTCSACPGGYVARTTPTDCDDSDPNARPGQSLYYQTPSNGGTFDYNCNGTPEPQQVPLVTSCNPYAPSYCDPCYTHQSRTGLCPSAVYVSLTCGAYTNQWNCQLDIDGFCDGGLRPQSTALVVCH